MEPVKLGVGRLPEWRVAWHSQGTEGEKAEQEEMGRGRPGDRGKGESVKGLI